MTTTIIHQSIQLDWTKPSQIGLPKTLVLGSFNPYNPMGKDIVDFYYGRESNHLWRSIARIKGHRENYYFDKELGKNRKINIMYDKFCCLDVIDKLNFTSDNSLLLNKFIKENIFSGYADQTIWRSKINGGAINLSRSYNQLVIDTLKDSTSITKVIHTMGINRIKTVFQCNPKEARLERSGFGGYIKEINNICLHKGIEFNLNSLSPSGYAIKRGATKPNDLDQWLMKNLNLL